MKNEMMASDPFAQEIENRKLSWVHSTDTAERDKLAGRLIMIDIPRLIARMGEMKAEALHWRGLDKIS